ncbi:unnamed protein product [Protopolystoma xenopodis]|uniref:Choline transporter-like protein n=1 Tax=Protopolystoma xenopodis TaxID=117903 RepID=A0A3S5FCF7_9PLAT|nr:unnamed protein product [Protopolystoma xenopodis]
MPAFPLALSFWHSLRYHIGSLAFGSLIIAMLKLIRILLQWLQSKLKSADNAVARFFLKCFACCFWCLEKFLRFLNRNAYILVRFHND